MSPALSDAACPDFIAALAPSLTADRPHVTLTWAQSVDGKLAGPGGARVLISGEESMRMTHWLRATHDAILVGIYTLIMDDPRLKLSLPAPHAYPSPQPLILDPTLRIPLAARILTEWRSASPTDVTAQRTRQPWVVCGDGVAPARVEAVEHAGARVIRVPLKDGRIPPAALPVLLARLALRSVMIEGGARVLSSFLRAPARPDGSPLVDTVIITTGPMLIDGGVDAICPAGPNDSPLATLVHRHTEVMGKDTVVVCTVAPSRAA
ncbi:2,5-diamino-6-(ribosylamino)-4(3H)-pyrimidinone 5'-phosphate reductase [Cryptotrichosporon argae]